MIPTLVATSATPMNTVVAVSSPAPQPSREAGGERDDRPRAPPTARGGAADLAHLRQPRLEADPEQQEDDAQLGEDLEHLAGLDEPEHRRPDQHAGEDLPDEAGLAEPLEQLLAGLRGEQDDEQVEQDVGGRARRGDGRHVQIHRARL